MSIAPNYYLHTYRDEEASKFMASDPTATALCGYQPSGEPVDPVEKCPECARVLGSFGTESW